MPGFPGPKSTVSSATASKFVPVIVILLALPPAKGPEVGEIDVMVGVPAAEAGATPTTASVVPRVPRPSAAARRALLHRPAMLMARGDSSAKPRNRRLMRYWPPPGTLRSLSPLNDSGVDAATPQTARNPCGVDSYGKRWPSNVNGPTTDRQRTGNLAPGTQEPASPTGTPPRHRLIGGGKWRLSPDSVDRPHRYCDLDQRTCY